MILNLQWRGNAYGAEFGRHPDEASHCVNGLLFRDYLSRWPPSAPLGFAQTDYLHYPKVSIGHWPPGFYILEAAWMLLFGASRASIEILLALLAAVLGAFHYRHELSSPDEAQHAIERLGIALRVLDREPGPELPHHGLLDRMVTENSDRWRLIERFRGEPNLPGFALHQYRGDALSPFSPERLAATGGPVGENLGRSPADGEGRP